MSKKSRVTGKRKQDTRVTRRAIVPDEDDVSVERKAEVNAFDALMLSIRQKFQRYEEDDEGALKVPPSDEQEDLVDTIMGARDRRRLEHVFKGYSFYRSETLQNFFQYTNKVMDLYGAHINRIARRVESNQVKLDALLDMKRMGEIDAAHGALTRALRNSL